MSFSQVSRFNLAVEGKPKEVQEFTCLTVNDNQALIAIGHTFVPPPPPDKKKKKKADKNTGKDGKGKKQGDDDDADEDEDEEEKEVKAFVAHHFFSFGVDGQNEKMAESYKVEGCKCKPHYDQTRT